MKWKFFFYGIMGVFFAAEIAVVAQGINTKNIRAEVEHYPKRIFRLQVPAEDLSDRRQAVQKAKEQLKDLLKKSSPKGLKGIDLRVFSDFQMGLRQLIVDLQKIEEQLELMANLEKAEAEKGSNSVETGESKEKIKFAIDVSRLNRVTFSTSDRVGKFGKKALFILEQTKVKKQEKNSISILENNLPEPEK